MWDHMQGYGVMGFGGLFGIFVWLLILVGIVMAVIWVVGPSRGSGKSPSAMDILKQRYASGEISEEQYHRMKEEIEGKG